MRTRMLSAGVVAALLIGVATPGVTAQSGPAARAAALLFGASTVLAQSKAQAAGRHVIEGQVTKVDAKRGWVDVKTPEGSMKLHFPPTALEGVKKGDSVSVEVAMTTSPAPERTDRAPRTK
jgi:hypothetical protein